MTDEEMNLAIQELCKLPPLFAVEKGNFYYRENSCGYTSELELAGRYTWEQAKAQLVKGENMHIVPLKPRDYCADLNAMHQAEKILTHAQKADYVYEIGKVKGATIFQYDSVCAPARQRAEAFIATLAK